MDYAVFFILLFLWVFQCPKTALFSIGKSHTLGSPNLRMPSKMIADILSTSKRLLIGVLLGNELTNVAFRWSAIHYKPISDESLSLALLYRQHRGATPLIFGEITPKTLAAKRPEILARIVIAPLHFSPHPSNHHCLAYLTERFNYLVTEQPRVRALMRLTNKNFERS